MSLLLSVCMLISGMPNMMTATAVQDEYTINETIEGNIPCEDHVAGDIALEGEVYIIEEDISLRGEFENTIDARIVLIVFLWWRSKHEHEQENTHCYSLAPFGLDLCDYVC